MRRFASHLFGVPATVLIGALAGGTLVRFGPGFESDDRDLGSKLSNASLAAVHEQRAAERNLLSYYPHYLRNLIHGDLGISRSLGVPVRGLVAERAAVTLELTAFGVAGGWLLGLALAIPAAIFRNPLFDLLANTASGLFLCLPAAVLALFLYFGGGPIRLAIALTVFPKVFRFTRDLLGQAFDLPYVIAARSRGISPRRVFLWHVVPFAMPHLLALAGICVTIAFATALPVEVVCDLPGIGQLAWKAAVARDLPVLVGLALLITLFTRSVSAASDLASRRLAGNPA